MRSLNSFILLGTILLLFGCGKIARKANVVRDCTGTYARMNNKDFLVVNPASLSNYSTNESIRINYENVKLDEVEDNSICELYHEYCAAIRITDVK